MVHNWIKLFRFRDPGANLVPAGIERCECGVFRLTQEDDKYSYFKPGWSSPEEPLCERQGTEEDSCDGAPDNIN